MPKDMRGQRETYLEEVARWKGPQPDALELQANDYWQRRHILTREQLEQGLALYNILAACAPQIYIIARAHCLKKRSR